MKTIVYCYEHWSTALGRRIKGAYSAVGMRGWRLQPVDLRNRGMTPGKAVRFWDAVGVVVEGDVLEDRRFRSPVFEGLGVPVVVCDPDESRKSDTMFIIRHDSRATAEVVIRELLKIDYPHYAFVGYRTRRDWSELRKTLFVEAMRKAGKECRVFEPWRMASAVSADPCFRSLVEWIAGLPRPCGVFAVNDEMGEDVIAAAHIKGIAVPDDLAVVGIDDEVFCESTNPPLASVAPDFEESGRLAIGLLEQQLSDPWLRPVSISFGNAPFVMRGSLRIFKRRDFVIGRAVEFIRVNACNGIGVDDVAASMGVGRRTASERFRRSIGRSILEEIESQRLERAKRLLSDPSVHLKNIDALCGYSSGHVFRRFFQRMTGMTPSQWRQLHG